MKLFPVTNYSYYKCHNFHFPVLSSHHQLYLTLGLILSVTGAGYNYPFLVGGTRRGGRDWLFPTLYGMEESHVRVLLGCDIGHDASRRLSEHGGGACWWTCYGPLTPGSAIKLISTAYVIRTTFFVKPVIINVCTYRICYASAWCITCSPFRSPCLSRRRDLVRPSLACAMIPDLASEAPLSSSS